MKFIMPRDRTVATTKGHCIGFKKGVPTFVPYGCYDEVQAAGAVPEDELPDDTAKAVQDPQGAERDSLIAMALEEVILKNNPKDFTAAGMPHVKVLETKLGFNIDAYERDAAWTKFNAVKD